MLEPPPICSTWGLFVSQITCLFRRDTGGKLLWSISYLPKRQKKIRLQIEASLAFTNVEFVVNSSCASVLGFFLIHFSLHLETWALNLPSTFCVHMQTCNVYLIHIIMYACICRVLCYRGFGFFKRSHPYCLIWAWKMPFHYPWNSIHLWLTNEKLEIWIFPPPFRKMLAAFKIMSSYTAILSMAFWHYQRYNKRDSILASSPLLSVLAINSFSWAA